MRLSSPTKPLSVLRRSALLALLSLLGALPPAFGQLAPRRRAFLSFPEQVPAGPQVLRNAFSGPAFSQPLAIANAPGLPDTAFVVEFTGTIQAINTGSHSRQTFFDVRSVLAPNETFYNENESGLLGLAFHPGYATNRTFYVFYSVKILGQLHQRLARVRATSQSLLLADPATHEVLISQPDDGANHNGGDLHFGPDGYLYVSLGDEGAANDDFDNARWVDRDFHAALLRIDVDRKNVGQPGGSVEPNPHPAIVRDTQGKARYAIPPDNPLLSGAAGTLGPIGAGSFRGGMLQASTLRTEFFAYGLRNPWRFSFDPPTGRLFVADVGQDQREEINLVTKGAHLGWPYREGTLAGPRTPAPDNPGSPRIEPIHDYPRTDGYSITGGRVYRGSAFPELAGAYIFADYSGGVYALRESSAGWTRELLVRNAPGIAGIGRLAGSEELFFASLYTGEILRLFRQSVTSSLPARLSATGLFSDTSALAPASGVVPYEINHPSWNDHARARRWFALPTSGPFYASRIGEAWSPPDRIVWVQHLELETERGNPATARRVETRVLVKSRSETYGVSYLWREDQSDADLAPPAGADLEFTITVDGAPTTQRWRIPGWNDCLSCHSPGSGPARAFDLPQLNRVATHGSVTENQIRQLYSAGYVSLLYPPADADYARLPAFPAPDDETQSVEHRLRTYLAVNCSPCHTPSTAPSGASAFSVASTLTTEASRLRSAIPKNLGGDPDARLLSPGSAEHSMLLRRILGDGVPRMPPVGPRETDPAAEALLRAYIARLPSEPTYDEWHRAHFDGGVPAREKATDPDGDTLDNFFEYLTHGSPVAANPDPVALRVETAPAGGRTARFRQPARRAAILEYQAGSTWEPVPAPEFGYPAQDVEREVAVPATIPWPNLRVRLEER